MRLTRLVIIVTILGSIALGAASSAGAATPCWRQVVNDWYRNNRVDGTYPIHCYSEAIANLPEDVKGYSNAPDDIRRAMLLAIRGDSSSGGSGPGGDGGTAPTGFGSAAGPGTGFQATGKNDSKNNGFLGSFFDTFGPKNASSIPLPLIILAAVALLLLAAGAASFVARRIQSRRVDPPRP
jgi:hypothetical protein